MNTLTQKTAFVDALIQEIKYTKHYLEGEKIETIYLGGGTPSQLSAEDLDKIFNELYSNHSISLSECTIEVNPDDLSQQKLYELRKSPINRLSIGIQSFFDADLQYMNRAHNADEAEKSIIWALNAGFDNITIDLIYGTPGLNLKGWEYNLEKAIALSVPHLSCYALTVEPKTKLYQHARKGIIEKPNDETTISHFDFLMNYLPKHSFVQYEISNFAKENYLAIHNTNYWKGKKYLGLGPSAHSFNLNSRRWNVSNLNTYIKGIRSKESIFHTEILSDEDKINEQIMTSLRTQWGFNLADLNQKYSPPFLASLEQIPKEYYTISDNHLYLTQQGKHFADYIASELFII